MSGVKSEESIFCNLRNPKPKIFRLEKQAIAWANKCLVAHGMSNEIEFEEYRDYLYDILNELVDLTRSILPYWIKNVPEVRRIKSAYDKKVEKQIQKGWDYYLENFNLDDLSDDEGLNLLHSNHFKKWDKRMEQLYKWVERPESEREQYIDMSIDAADKTLIVAVDVRRPL